MKRFSMALFVAATAVVTVYADTVIVDEKFESYADQAAFKATWMPMPLSCNGQWMIKLRNRCPTARCLPANVLKRAAVAAN